MSMARRSGSAQAQVGAVMQGGVILATGEPRRAMSAFLEAAAIAARAGIKPGQVMGLGNAAETAIDLGELDVAARALAEADEIGGGGTLDQDGVTLCHALLGVYRGDLVTAHADLDRLEADRRADWDAVQMTTWFLRTRSAVHLIEGDWAAALADARESIALEASGGNAANCVWQGVQAAARLGEADAIAALLADTAGLRGEWIDSVRATAEAAVVALHGDAKAGAEAITTVLTDWRDRDFPLDHAFAAGLALHVLPPDVVPQADVDAARAYLQQLHAEGILRLF